MPKTVRRKHLYTHKERKKSHIQVQWSKKCKQLIKHRSHSRKTKKKAGVLNEEAKNAFIQVCQSLFSNKYTLVESGISKNRYFFFKKNDEKIVLFEAIHKSVDDNKHENESLTQSVVVTKSQAASHTEKVLIPQIVLRAYYTDGAVVNENRLIEDINKNQQDISSMVYDEDKSKFFTIDVLMHKKSICTLDVNVLKEITDSTMHNTTYIKSIKDNLSTLEHPETQAIINYLNYQSTDYYIKFDVDNFVTQTIPGFVLSHTNYHNSLFTNLWNVNPVAIDLDSLKHMLCSVMFFDVRRAALKSASMRAKKEKAVLSGLVTLKILIKMFVPIPDFKPLIDELYRQYEETAKEHMEASMEAFYFQDLVDNVSGEIKAPSSGETTSPKAEQTIQPTQYKKGKCIEIQEILVNNRTVPALNERMSVPALLDVIGKWACSQPNLNGILSKMFNIPKNFISNIYPQTFEVQGCANVLQVVAMVKIHQEKIQTAVFKRKPSSVQSIVVAKRVSNFFQKRTSARRKDVGSSQEEPTNDSPPSSKEKKTDVPSTNPHGVMNELFQLDCSEMQKDASGMYSYVLVLHISKSIHLKKQIVNSVLPFVDGGSIHGAIIHPELLHIYSLDKFASKQEDIAETETMTSPIYAISKKMANSIKVEALLQTLKEKIDAQAKTIQQLQSSHSA